MFAAVAEDCRSSLLKQRVVLTLIYSAGLHLKVLGKIASCTTAALGGHEEACQNCGTVRYSNNSCDDRHCPKCQATKQAFWIKDLMLNTLPIMHFHIVFTVPLLLNTVCLHNQRILNIADGKVTIVAKDYRQGAIK